MFTKRPSPAKKKFATPTTGKKRRRPLDPRTVVLIKQGVFGLLLLCIVAVATTAVWYGSRVSFLTISTVTASGGETISTTEVAAAAQRLLEGEYIGLVPRRFAWWYPKEEILAAVTSVPRLKNPYINRVGGTKLQITFEEYLPYALWCESKDSDNCIFIDAAGYAFTPAPQLTGGALPRFITIGTTPVIGATMVPLSDMQAMEMLRREVSKELSLPIAYVETDIMRDVFMGVSGGGEIKASLRLTPQETFENLRSVLSAPEFADIKPGSFQYIDLRFGNKVFVNEEEGVLPGLTSSSSATSTKEVE